MKLAIMQPYFFPYTGYWQLIAAVDIFIVYDNIKYTKKGWINRNRFLLKGRDAVFSIPLQKASDSLNIVDRHLAGNFDRAALINQLAAAYQMAPHFSNTFPLIVKIIENPADNLFEYLHASIVSICLHLDIRTRIIVSSKVDIDHTLKKQDKVIAFCSALGAATYINSIGGRELYRHEDFSAAQIELRFLEAGLSEYPQHRAPFIPWLSIIDVLMFNPINETKRLIRENCRLIS